MPLTAALPVHLAVGLVHLQPAHRLAQQASPDVDAAIRHILKILYARLRPDSDPRSIPLGQTSSIRVTGPSLVSSTAMFAPNEPVATVAPRRRSSATNSSIRRAASSGGAAAMNDGRRPLRVSP